MSVPALTTTNIATFAWYLQTGCTQVTLADVLGILHSYVQYDEYIDGTIKVFDTGSESAAPNNYVLVNVRIRKDGYILAWFARELTAANQTVDSAITYVITDTGCQIQNYDDSSPRAIVANELAGNILEFTSGALSGNRYTIQSNTATTITLHNNFGDNQSTDVSGSAGETYRIYSCRGNMVWWGHHSSSSGNPTTQSTRLGRALYEMWEQLKTNQVGGSGASLDYTDVNYYDYEYTSATHLYIFGYSISINGLVDKYYYFTVPTGRTSYDISMTYGKYHHTSYGGRYCTFVYNAVTKYLNTTTITSGFLVQSGLTQTPGAQNTVRHYYGQSGTTGHSSTALVVLTDG